MKKSILLILSIITFSVCFAQKDSSFIPKDSTEFMSIADIQQLMTVVEKSPEFDKVGYIQVNKALNYLIQIAIQRKNLPNKGKKK